MIQTVEFGKPCEATLVLALGFFDGMHMGHRMISDKVIELANAAECIPAISTFSDNPNRKEVIYCYHERRRLYEECGLQLCLSLSYLRISRLTGREFFDRLTETYRIAHLVCGADYKFGCDGCGVETLRAWCAEKNIGLTVVPLLIYHGVRVSSTAVKSFLQAGDIKSANLFLQSRYRIRGEVVRGDGRGHNIGIPTVNLDLPIGIMEIRRGVYGTYAEVGGETYRSVTNFGSRPTFSQSRFAVETHLIGYEGDCLLGKEVVVYFHRYLRAIRTFASPEELVARIQADKEWKE